MSGCETLPSFGDIAHLVMAGVRLRPMVDEREIQELFGEEKRSEKTGKYKPLPRNKRTERETARIFESGTEAELMRFLRGNGLKDESPRFAEILRLFREHGGRRR